MAQQLECPECGCKVVRTFSFFNEKNDRWEWWKGCGDCDWQKRDKDEELLHPEYYQRLDNSPAMIKKKDVRIRA